MAIKENNKLFEENIKDSAGRYYHLDEDDVKKAKEKEVQPKEEETYPRDITKEELAKLDPSFNESMFITKVNNMFVKFFTAIMLDEMEDIKHFVSDDVYEYGLNILNNAKARGVRQMYDMLNVKNSRITNYAVNENVYTINVYLQSRYLNYIISLESGDVLSGNDHDRIQVDYNIELTKRRNALEQGIARKCPGCGASISVNTSGKCEYCGSIYNQEDYDWVITKLKSI